MRTFALTLTIATVFGLTGAANALWAEEAGVAHCSDHACPPPQLVSECPQTCKVCIAVPKKNTKVVYSSVCHDYCLPKCTLRCLFGHGCHDCGDGCETCGKVKTRHVLVKKIVPACDTKDCVIREQLVPQCQSAPACDFLPAAPMPAPGNVVPVKPAPAK